MGISRDLKKSIRAFAQVMIQGSNAKADFTIGPWIGIPKNLAADAVDAGFDPETVLVFTKDESAIVNRTHRALSKEPVLKHLAPKEVTILLNEFAWRLTIENEINKDPKVRKALVDDFIRQLEAPITNYSVLFPIEWLNISDEQWVVGSVTIKLATQYDLDDWFPDNWFDRIADELPEIGTTIAIAETVAGSPQIAAKRTSSEVDASLDLIRLCVAQFGFRIWDNEMRFCRLSRYFAKRQTDSRAIFSSVDYSDRMHTLKLNSDALGKFGRKNLISYQAPWSATFPKPLGNDLVRAIRWIGKSIASADMDDKVVGLCTALECLLSTRSHGLKSNEITWRSMTLGEISEEGFTHPAKIMNLYEMRSDIIHGSAFNICTESDYRILANTAIDIFSQILRLVESNPTITSKSKLFAALDSPDIMQKCLDWCKMADPKVFASVINSMSKQIEKQSTDRI